MAVLLLALTLGSIFAALRFANERDKALASQRRAESAEEQLAGRLWQSYVSQARAQRNSHLVGQRFQSLDAMAAAARIRVSNCGTRRGHCLPRPGRPPTDRISCRSDRWKIWDTPSMPRWSDSPSPTGPAPSACAGCPDGTELLRLPRDAGYCTGLRFCPDPRYLAAQYQRRDGHSRGILWDLGQPERPKRVAEVTDDIFLFSPDGKRMAARIAPETVGIYQTGGAEPSDRLNVGNLTHVLAFSPDGRRIAILDSPARTIRIYDLETRGLVWSHEYPTAPRRWPGAATAGCLR